MRGGFFRPLFSRQTPFRCGAAFDGIDPNVHPRHLHAKPARDTECVGIAGRAFAAPYERPESMSLRLSARGGLDNRRGHATQFRLDAPRAERVLPRRTRCQAPRAPATKPLRSVTPARTHTVDLPDARVPRRRLFRAPCQLRCLAQRVAGSDGALQCNALVRRQLVHAPTNSGLLMTLYACSFNTTAQAAFHCQSLASSLHKAMRSPCFVCAFPESFRTCP